MRRAAGTATLHDAAHTMRRAAGPATRHDAAHTMRRAAGPATRHDAASREETEEMLAAEQSFRERYRAALMRLRERAAVLFPPGTFLLWRFFGALREAYAPGDLAGVTRT